MSPDRAQTVLLHNPNCSKSRMAKALLNERGVEYVERRYLDEPLSVEELRELRSALDTPPSAWVRRKERAYAKARLRADSSEEQLLEAIAEDPVLMERPILIRGEVARIGRPPESILELLEKGPGAVGE